jgi:CRISPR-associated protein Cas2
MSEAHIYLVAYDVASPKRWRRVVKALKKRGMRVQLSIFMCRMTPGRVRVLERRLRHIMDSDEDRLMISDLGPARNAASRLRAENMIHELQELEALVV